MKIKPVRKVRAPRYPSQEEARLHPEWLAAAPRRWRANPGLAALLGFGLLAPALESEADETPVVVVLPEAVEAVREKVEKTAATLKGQAEKAVDTVMVKAGMKSPAWVAPVLAEALERDGRGGFGCVAVSPPVFLSEAEAIEIVQAELKAAGLEVEPFVKMEGVLGPDPEAEPWVRAENEKPTAGADPELTAKFQKAAGEHRSAPSIVKSDAVFDLGDRKRRVFVEYLSIADFDRWMGNEMSTASYVDFPKLVPLVAEALGRRAADKEDYYGIFFDPLASLPMGGGEIRRLSPAQRRVVAEAGAARDPSNPDGLADKSREKLRAQVRYFAEQLRGKGVLPPKG